MLVLCDVVFALSLLYMRRYSLYWTNAKLHVERSKSTVCFILICQPHNHFMTNLLVKQILLREEERKSIIYEWKAIKRTVVLR